MNLRLLVVLLVGAVTPTIDVRAQASAASDSAERRALVAVLSGYHDALARSQPERVLEYLGPTYFMGNDWSVPQPERVQAHLFLSGERLSRWPANYLSQVAPHRNAFAVVSASMRGDAAVVITRDTGSNAFRAWRDEETTWYLGRINGSWRIVGMVIRDFQAPK